MSDIIRKIPYVGADQFRPGAVAHQAADLTDRALATWLPALSSADAEILPEFGPLTSRSRDLERNHPMVAGVVQTYADGIVGPKGLRFSSKPDYLRLGKDRQWAAELARQIEALWREATESTDIDASRTQNLAGLTDTALRGVLLSGGVLALPRWDKTGRRGSRFKTYLQLVEIDRLSNPQEAPDSDRLRGGIELDREGAPVAYYVRKAHPGDAHLAGASLWPYTRRLRTAPGGVILGTANLMSAYEWERIPARTPWGRPRVLHLFRKTRPGMTRGKTFLAPIMADLKMLGHYKQTEMRAAIVNAMVAAFVETPLPEELLSQLFGDIEPDALSDLLAQRQAARPGLNGGAILSLYPGEKLESFNPNRPAGNYAPFVDKLLSEVAVGLNLAPSIFLKDFRQNNYSSARADALESWRFFRNLTQFLASYWNGQILRLYMEEWVNDGLLPIDPEDYYQFPAAYCRGRWDGPPRGNIDPVKEATADKIKLETGTTTLEDVCAKDGSDWEEIQDQQALEHQRAAEKGLPFSPPTQITVVAGGDETAPKEDEDK
ncbi:MAG: phage portal protein [Deltaproteobacteria bacterium]|nr:phage portal protein [Deltaproteobacteria bacterium]